MGILSNILSKIFPSSHPATAPAPDAAVKPAAGATPVAAPAGNAPSAAAATAGPAAMTEVDVEAMLDDLASKSAEKLNWKTSIVDLMKLLGLDSSLAARKELAQELHYSGDMNDSTAMNVWLHRQVMTKVATNGARCRLISRTVPREKAVRRSVLKACTLKCARDCERPPSPSIDGLGAPVYEGSPNHAPTRLPWSSESGRMQPAARR